jgi:hypothetical protein
MIYSYTSICLYVYTYEYIYLMINLGDRNIFAIYMKLRTKW